MITIKSVASASTNPGQMSGLAEDLRRREEVLMVRETGA
jgi:hypothetical protein